jgi:hypothetical protein
VRRACDRLVAHVRTPAETIIVKVKLEPIIEMPCMVTGNWRRFAVHVFEGKATLADMAAIEASSEKWHAKIRDQIVEMVIILPSEAKMTGDERSKMTHIIKRWENTRIASSTIVLARGLLGSLHRSVLTGMQMVVPPPHPTKVFGVIDDGLRWLTPFIQKSSGADAQTDALMIAVDNLIAYFGKRPVKAPMH